MGEGSTPRALRLLPIVLRAAVLALLAALLLVPSLSRPHGATARTLRIRSAADPSSADPSRLAELLVVPRLAAVTYEAADAPSPAALGVLAGAAERAPLFVAAPPTARLVDAAVTPHPLTGRAAAVSFRLRGPAGDSARLYLTEAGAVADSLSVAADSSGEAVGAFRVRPAASGWRAWSVRAVWPRGDSAVAEAGAWVDSAGAPRVLIRAGLPDWESKFVTRALEESGAAVDESTPLGRGLAVAEGAGSAITPDRLARADAVIVLDGAPLSAAEATTLAEWTARGGGVLLAGDRAGTAGFGLVRPGAAEATVDGSGLRWSLPAELAALPPDRVSAAAQPFAGVATGAVVAASTPAGGVLALRPLGVGRAAALALTETWRWRMEAGRIAEHREFWRSLADWLSSVRPQPLAVALPASTGAVGERVDVRVYDRRGVQTGAPVPPLVVTRPRAAADSLRLTRDPSSPDTWRGSFVPAAAGLYTLTVPGRAPTAAFRADRSPAAAADAWARLGAIAYRSGGRMVPRDSLPSLLARLAPAAGSHALGPAAWLVILVLLTASEWAIRRLTGRA